MPAVLSCLGTSPGLKGFGLPDALPAGPVFPETGDAVMANGKQLFKRRTWPIQTGPQ